MRMLSIDSLPFPGSSGVIGLSRCPGTGLGNPLQRGKVLQEEIGSIAEWGATAVLTLNETSELQWLGVDGLGAAVSAAGMQWWHCPIVDFRAPGPDFEAVWQPVGPSIEERLLSGERILIHCLAGLGRTGTIAARLLMEQGMAPQDAIGRVRMARPGSIQSDEQMRYLKLQAWKAWGRDP